MKTVAVIGSGTVGQVLADGFLKHGYQVVRATREPAKLDGWLKAAGPHASVLGVTEAVKQAQLVVLAVKGTVAEAVVAGCADALGGKTVIDATNPIADAPPTNGVIAFFTDLNESLLERLQKRVPAANFVKAFSCVGNAFMVDPKFPGGPPTMFICGTQAAAKAEVKEVLGQFGWDTEDLGAVEAARAIEPLCMLWCIPGMIGRGWMHAFKLLRA